MGKESNAGPFSRTFMTPQNKTELMSVAAAADAKKQQIALNLKKQKTANE